MLLVVAGVYQLTPPKQACLRRCRSPHTGVDPPVGTRVPGHPGAVRAGLGQGGSCLGSSWPLMLVLLLVGTMNLAWMGVIAGVIVVEKVVPGGDAVSKVVGGAFADWGIIMLAAPHTLPALGGVLGGRLAGRWCRAVHAAWMPRAFAVGIAAKAIRTTRQDAPPHAHGCRMTVAV